MTKEYNNALQWLKDNCINETNVPYFSSIANNQLADIYSDEKGNKFHYGLSENGHAPYLFYPEFNVYTKEGEYKGGRAVEVERIFKKFGVKKSIEMLKKGTEIII